MKELQQYLIQGATSYLEYLENSNKGIEEISILNVRINNYNTLLLGLERVLISTDFLQLHIRDYIIDVDIIEEKNFNEITKVLKLCFQDSLLQRFVDGFMQELDTESRHDINIHSILAYLLDNNYKKQVPTYLRIFSDLKFLVRNIRDFCMQDSLELMLPKQKPIPLKIKLDSYINKEQKEAINGIFTHSISYVWGISGSGKTQVVLFNCLLNIITQNKKALILAPTNTALEQIFIALIKQGDKKGLNRHRFLRLGMPSSDFLQNFPEVCIHTDDKEDIEATSLFKSQMLKERLQDSLVVGVTLDSFVKRYNQLCDLDFVHIFLDECAFSPLVKLIAPLTLNIPITLLGDHKQLMPICLMQDTLIREKYKSACIWYLNTLFIETLFQSNSTLHQKNNHDDIEFNAISHYKLTTTHRYGNNLAQVLNKHVYHNGLCGVGMPTEIFYVDSMRFGQGYTYNQQNPTNENIGEANATILLTRTMSNNYAVLTPFRDQQKLLRKKGINKNNVFTIHKSQGKEFDTIVFSPVKYSKNMTCSNNKSALFALNVAVSRLKKRLIIVCDYSFWITKQTQFITALLNHAKPYPLT